MIANTFNPAALWDGIDRAEIFERGRYFKPNFEGIVQVKKTVVRDTFKSGVAFIVEVEVMWTNMPEDHPIGSKGTWFQGLSKNKATAFGNIAKWIAACAGYFSSQKAEIDEKVRPHMTEMMVYATNNPDRNHFTSIYLNLRTYLIKTREKGEDFTVYDFEPYIPSSQQQPQQQQQYQQASGYPA
jgi:hypothetical protein